jgi:hypothetical protein
MINVKRSPGGVFEVSFFSRESNSDIVEQYVASPLYPTGKEGVMASTIMSKVKGHNPIVILEVAKFHRGSISNGKHLSRYVAFDWAMYSALAVAAEQGVSSNEVIDDTGLLLAERNSIYRTPFFYAKGPNNLGSSILEIEPKQGRVSEETSLSWQADERNFRRKLPRGCSWKHNPRWDIGIRE